MANPDAASSTPQPRASPYQIVAEASLRHADRITSEHRRAMRTIIFDLMRDVPGIRQVRDMASPPLDLRWHVNSTALRRATESIALFYKASTYTSTTPSPRQRLACALFTGPALARRTSPGDSTATAAPQQAAQGAVGSLKGEPPPRLGKDVYRKRSHSSQPLRSPRLGLEYFRRLCMMFSRHLMSGLASQWPCHPSLALRTIEPRHGLIEIQPKRASMRPQRWPRQDLRLKDLVQIT